MKEVRCSREAKTPFLTVAKLVFAFQRETTFNPMVCFPYGHYCGHPDLSESPHPAVIKLANHLYCSLIVRQPGPPTSFPIPAATTVRKDTCTV
jgi:hypothetical protein